MNLAPTSEVNGQRVVTHIHRESVRERAEAKRVSDAHANAVRIYRNNPSAARSLKFADKLGATGCAVYLDASDCFGIHARR